jgi:hypothetical protein
MLSIFPVLPRSMHRECKSRKPPTSRRRSSGSTGEPSASVAPTWLCKTVSGLGGTHRISWCKRLREVESRKQVPRVLKADLADDPKTLVVGRIGGRGCAKTLGLMTSPNHPQITRAFVCFGLYGGSAFRLVSMPGVFAYEAGGGYASV